MSNLIHSMTGFARAERASGNATICWELRSVNHRYLDVSLRVGDGLKHVEHEFRAQIGERLARGKIDGTLTINIDEQQAMRIELDLNLLRSLRDASRNAEGVFGKLRKPSALDLLRWPGVLQESRPDLAPLIDAIRATLGDALGELVAMRNREGQHLADTLRQRCAEIVRLRDAVASRHPEVIAAIRVRLLERLQRVDVEADPARLETELAIIAQKMDIDEELDRLSGHISEIDEILENGSPCGRKLEFLIQELNREANTLSSKSADSDTTKAAVDMKVAIEQMREQVQNIE